MPSISLTRNIHSSADSVHVGGAPAPQIMLCSIIQPLCSINDSTKDPTRLKIWFKKRKSKKEVNFRNTTPAHNMRGSNTDF
jgi:hypothetical protein